MKPIRAYLISISILLVLMSSASTQAETRIAILDFELNDITSLPNTPKELVRTASIKPLLDQAMASMGDYEIIHISLEQQQLGNAGLGYLFRFHDISARLGKDVGADWIIVGQHSKPSFLYSYLMANVVNVQTGELAARLDIEMKGNNEKVTQRGVSKMSRKIDKVITKLGVGSMQE